MNFNEANVLIDRIGAVSIMEIEERAYLFSLASNPQNKPVMEIGSAAGGTTILLAVAAGFCHALDNGAGKDHRLHFANNIKKAGVDSRVKFHLGDACEIANKYPDDYFGLVLVDAEHTGEHPYQDLTAWAPKVKPGGYLLADDLSDGTPDVTIGIIRFLTQNHQFDFDRAFERIDNGYKQIKLLSLRRKTGK